MRVPVSWVREHCAQSDIHLWAEHQQIKAKRRDDRRRKERN